MASSRSTVVTARPRRRPQTAPARRRQARDDDDEGGAPAAVKLTSRWPGSAVAAAHVPPPAAVRTRHPGSAAAAHVPPGRPISFRPQSAAALRRGPRVKPPPPPPPPTPDHWFGTRFRVDGQSGAAVGAVRQSRERSVSSAAVSAIDLLETEAARIDRFDALRRYYAVVSKRVLGSDAERHSADLERLADARYADYMTHIDKVRSNQDVRLAIENAPPLWTAPRRQRRDTWLGEYC